MSSGSSDSPNDTFFGDPPGPDSNHNRQLQPSAAHNEEAAKDCDAANRPKRIACVLCRKRKLRCDGARPTCGTCKRLAHDCAYDEVRKKSGPKRGYVKLLEARLHQVEKLLKTQESGDKDQNAANTSASSYLANTLSQNLPEGGAYRSNPDQVPSNFTESITPGPQAGTVPHSANIHSPMEMVGLGLEEPLPPQDVINDLYKIYFAKVHPSIPLIHKPRFLAAMNLGPHLRPPVSLRYIIWALAALVTEKYDGLQEHFYQRARKYAQLDEMRGHGESTITLAHCQTWILMSTYEFKQMYFPRAWLSTGRAVRLAQMMQLHRLDGAGLDVKQCLPPPKDWTEREERRRTFWLAFCIDRYASIGTGWPMLIDEQDILTNLPASEEAFARSKPMPTGSLEQALAPQGAASLQPLGGIVLTAALFGRNLLHLHRPGPDDRDNDMNGGFWTRHGKLENILLATALGLPDHLRLPSGLPDPNVVFLNMCLHTSAICLHQAAIFKADKYRLPVNVSNESKVRCVTAAAEIASIMRTISHLDLASMNPFIAFAVYVAARVFVQYLKTRPKDQQMTSSLQFLLQAMHALRKKNALTESFLVQLDLDLESAGLEGIQRPAIDPTSLGEVPINSDSVGCAAIFELRESQSATSHVNTFANGKTTVPSNAPPYPESTPSRPYQGAAGHVNMAAHSGYDYVPTHTVPIELPQRRRTTSNGIQMAPHESQLNDSEMDTSPDASGDQPTPSTINSRGGSTSHTSSYSPPHQSDELNNQHFHTSQEASGSLPQANQMALAGSSGPTTAGDFFSTTGEHIFPDAFYGNSISATQDDPMSNHYMLGSEWDLTGVGPSTGMTPLPEGSWSQMLESINMGWDSIGPPHGQARMS